MDEKVLKEIGFEDKEVQIYKMLLQLGIAPASKIASDLGMERTTTYYALLRMLEKGYVVETVKGHAKAFKATPPKKILSILQDRQERFQSILPNLEKIHNQEEQPFLIEVHQGNEGFRQLYKDAIASGGEILGLGVDDSQYMMTDEIALKQYYRDAKAKGVTERLITYKSAKTYGSPITKYRFIEKEYFQPTPFFIYGNKVVLVAWKPIIRLIYIENEELAESFRKHFELLWKKAK